MKEKLFALAIKIIIAKKTSPERAFDLAFKKLKCKGDRKELFQEFLKVVKGFYYASFVYPERSVEELVKIAEREDLPFKPPLWAEERLKAVTGLEDLTPLTLKQQWIRVNTLKADIEEVVSKLKRKGVELVNDSFPFLFRVVKSSVRISDLEEFKKGEIVIQDKASIYPVIFLNPKPNERILEVGSAPGMKTSLIQQLTNNSSYVIALDVSWKRLKLQRELMKRLGVENVDLLNADGANLPVKNVDKVLIDAPCSNSGTITSDPSLFLRLTKRDLLRLVRIQREILEETKKLGKPTVFSTCSLFPEEGEYLVEKYEKWLVPIYLSETNYGYKKSKVWMRVVRFYPNVHGTEGFFIAKFEF
jgi:16S rRNA (cytosine967-C5)-methyltransferase